MPGSDPTKMSRVASVAQSINPLQFAARRISGSASPAAGDQTTRQAIDHIQQIIEIAGLVDQSGIADVSNMLVSLMRAVDEPQQRWEHLKRASMSGVSALPLVGDLAKIRNQYRHVSLGVQTLQTVGDALDSTAQSPAVRDTMKASAAYAKAHPGVILSFVQRAAHLLQILSLQQKGKVTTLEASISALEEMRGAYGDWSADVSTTAVGSRLADEGMRELRRRAKLAKAAKKGAAVDEEDEDEEEDEEDAAEEVENAAAAIPAPAAVPVATGIGSGGARGGGGGGFGPGSRGQRYAGYGATAAATVLTGGAFMWWRRRQRRKAQREASRTANAGDGGYTVRLPDGGTMFYPRGDTGSMAQFSARPGGESQRVFWGSPQGSQQYTAGGGGRSYDDQTAAGEGTAPVTIAPPQGPGPLSRLARTLWYGSGAGYTIGAMGAAAGMAGTAARYTVGLPFVAAEKVVRTGAQLGAMGPLGMYMSGGPRAFLSENRDLYDATKNVIHGFKDLIQTIERTGTSLMMMQDYLVQYSGAFAMAKAQYIAEQIRRDMALAAATGYTYQGMVHSQSRLEDRTLKYKSLGSNLKNMIGWGASAGANAMLAVLENTTLWGAALAWLARQIPVAGGMAAYVDVLNDIAQGGFSTPRRGRKP